MGKISSSVCTLQLHFQTLLFTDAEGLELYIQYRVRGGGWGTSVVLLLRMKCGVHGGQAKLCSIVCMIVQVKVNSGRALGLTFLSVHINMQHHCRNPYVPTRAHTYRVPPCTDISISQECCIRAEDWVVLRVVHGGSTGAAKPDPADSFAVSLQIQNTSCD